MQTAGVLDGVKVADFSWIGAGPLTAMWLAQHDATVVRLESATDVGWSRLVTCAVENLEVADESAPLGHRRGRYTRL